jgi:hypothetical protein
MTSIAIPRAASGSRQPTAHMTAADYHTVGGGYDKAQPFIPRKA